MLWMSAESAKGGFGVIDYISGGLIRTLVAVRESF
jgi:hypothetical protein